MTSQLRHHPLEVGRSPAREREHTEDQQDRAGDDDGQDLATQQQSPAALDDDPRQGHDGHHGGLEVGEDGERAEQHAQPELPPVGRDVPGFEPATNVVEGGRRERQCRHVQHQRRATR